MVEGGVGKEGGQYGGGGDIGRNETKSIRRIC